MNAQDSYILYDENGDHAGHGTGYVKVPDGYTVVYSPDQTTDARIIDEVVKLDAFDRILTINAKDRSIIFEEKYQKALILKSDIDAAKANDPNVDLETVINDTDHGVVSIEYFYNKDLTTWNPEEFADIIIARNGEDKATAAQSEAELRRDLLIAESTYYSSS